MDKAQSLDSLMAGILRQMETMRPAMPDAPSEWENFMDQDPVLAGLHKEWETAKAREANLTAAKGQNDPMTEVARDVTQSARSAIETRMIELQERYRTAPHAKQAWCTDGQEEGAGAATKALQRHLEAFFLKQQAVLLKKLRKTGQDSIDSFIWMMFMLWLMDKFSGISLPVLSISGKFSLAAFGEPAESPHRA